MILLPVICRAGRASGARKYQRRPPLTHLARAGERRSVCGRPVVARPDEFRPHDECACLVCRDWLDRHEVRLTDGGYEG